MGGGSVCTTSGVSTLSEELTLEGPCIDDHRQHTPIASWATGGLVVRRRNDDDDLWHHAFVAAVTHVRAAGSAESARELPCSG